jgi:transcriptional regulator with XRE-family HTH domain
MPASSQKFDDGYRCPMPARTKWPLSEVFGIYLQRVLRRTNLRSRPPWWRWRKVSRGTVSEWVAGYNVPTPKNMQLLLAYFDLPLDEVLHELGEIAEERGYTKKKKRRAPAKVIPIGGAAKPQT